MFERHELHDLHLVLVERDRRVRRSLAGILEVDPRVTSVAAAMDVEEAVALVQHVGTLSHIDAVLIHLDDEDDVKTEEIARLRSALPAVRIVALTDDAPLGVRGGCAGADLSIGVSDVVDDICSLALRRPFSPPPMRSDQ